MSYLSLKGGLFFSQNVLPLPPEQFIDAQVKKYVNFMFLLA